MNIVTSSAPFLRTIMLAALHESPIGTTFSVRCAAAIPSGYRIVFAVTGTRLAGEPLIHFAHQ
jgi:hypothetical protein